MAVAANSVITVPASPPLVFLADKATSKSPVRWRVKEPADAQYKEYGNALLILNPVPGVRYKVTQTTYGDDPAVDIDSEEVVAPGVAPAPTPKPVDPPAPPGPGPQPTPQPQPDGGVVGNLRVLLLYESTANNAAAQINALNSPAVEKYLAAKCIKGLDGRSEWRRWDKDLDLTYAAPEWQAAMAAAKAEPTKVPKVVVFSGTTLVGTAPIADEAGLLAFLKSKGGN